MSFELGEALRRCGLETGGRRDLLEALATYADDETGLASVSQLSLALHAGVTERHARRILAALVADPRLEGLVRQISKPSGRGRAAVYRLRLERVEPLAAAVKIAQRACHAGAAKALMASGLVGAALSPHNMRRVFGCLRGLCRDEGHSPAAAAIAAQEALFEAVMASEAPDRLADGEKLPFGDLAPRPPGCGKPVQIPAGNPDILSQNPDISSSPHNKDSSTSRFSSPAGPESAPDGASGVQSVDGASSGAEAGLQGGECGGPMLAAAATAPGGFVIDPEALLAHFQGGRETIRAFVAAFRLRPARVTPDGVLAVRARSEREAFALCRDWLTPLTAWAAENGLSGVVFEAAPGGEATGPP